MKPKKVRMFILLAILAVIWGVFRSFPTFTEQIYSKGIYPILAKALHLAFGWVPFSLGDVLYTLFAIGVIVAIIRHFQQIWQKPLKVLDRVVTKTICLAFAFFILWGFNYFRMPLADTLQIPRKYTEAQLLEATKVCIGRANALHERLAANDSTKVDFRLSHAEIHKIAKDCYPLGEKGITDFTSSKSVKSSLYSQLLTYMGYSGYVNPFTNEAQVNGKIIGYSTPITACHEIAHQMGYAAEDEANYIGFLAAQKSDNLHFKYSAELFALRQLLNEVHRYLPEEYNALHAQIRKGILKNYDETRRFWSQYENKAEPLFTATYDTFLKMNKQSHGIRSYGLVIRLLIPYYL